MKLSRNAAAWELVCQRWQTGHHWFDDATEPAQRSAQEHLVKLKAIKPVAVNQQFALCGHCGLHTAQIFRDKAALRMQCPDCGPVAVVARDLKAWAVDEEWLIRKLRSALNVPAHQDVARITTGVWRIGLQKRQPVFLARRLDLLLQQASVLARGWGEATLSLITPKLLRRGDQDPFAGAARRRHLAAAGAYRQRSRQGADQQGAARAPEGRAGRPPTGDRACLQAGAHGA